MALIGGLWSAAKIATATGELKSMITLKLDNHESRITELERRREKLDDRLTAISESIGQIKGSMEELRRIFEHDVRGVSSLVGKYQTELLLALKQHAEDSDKAATD